MLAAVFESICGAHMVLSVVSDATVDPNPSVVDSSTRYCLASGSAPHHHAVLSLLPFPTTEGR